MDNEKIDGIIAEHGNKPGELLQILLQLQHENANHWLPREALERVSKKLDLPLALVQQTATFYKAFRLAPRSKHVIQVCQGTSCHICGSAQLLDAVQDLTGIKPGETGRDEKFTLETVNCLGRCAQGPVVEVDGKPHARMSPAKTAELLKKYE